MTRMQTSPSLIGDSVFKCCPFTPAGFPPDILDSDYLNDKYALLDVRENEYFENNIRFSKFALIKNLMKYGQPVNKTR